MQHEEHCPSCLSNYHKIHGMIYPAGSYIGNPCDDEWHKGPDYRPEVLKLTEEDRALLQELKVQGD